MTSTSSVRIDLAFAGLVPPPSTEELDLLRASIQSDGCRDALVLWREKGVLLDGHNRFRICKELGVPFQTVELSFTSRDAATEWIIRNQFGRRNLTPFQRAELALKLEPIVAAKAKARMLAGKKDPTQTFAEGGETRDEIANAAGVSGETIRKAKAIAEKAPEEVKEALRRGETTISAAFKGIERTEKPDSSPPPEIADEERVRQLLRPIKERINTFLAERPHLSAMTAAELKVFAGAIS